MNYKNEISPDKDTGWGLIYRLNDLLNEIENLVIQGKYDKWNFKLDRIWVNLCYRESTDILKEDGDIKEIKLKDTDIKEKEFLDRLIISARRWKNYYEKKLNNHPDLRPKYNYWKNQIYSKLLLKDIWIRKLMHKNNLYIKEIKHNPAGAMWGK